MRIACIATSRVPSRTANSIQVMKVCQALTELGHTIQLWLPDGASPVDWPELANHYGIAHPFPIKRVGAWRWLRRYDFCVLAVFQAIRWRAGLYYVWPLQAAALTSWMGLPTVLEAHDPPQGRLGPWLFARFTKGSGARRILPVSQALRQRLSQTFGRDFEPPFAVIAPNGIDWRYDRLPEPAEARRALGLEDAFTAVYTGHLYRGRGMELMIELARRNPSVAFVWAGGETEAIEHWRRATEELGIGNVRLLGFVPNAQLPMVQAAGDVLLMPYGRTIAVSGGGDTAPFASPMKMFEYMAAGRVILSSDLPVLREVLNDENAVLLPPEDAAAWHEALQAMMSQPERAARLGARAREDARRYTWRERAQASLAGIEVEGGETDDG